MENELKPCPFCGAASDQIRLSPAGLISTWIECTQCGAKSDTVIAHKDLAIEAAIKKWNRRPK